MDHLDTIILLMFIGAILVGIAQKMHIPYPIALVLGGGAIGFIPNLLPIYFDPKVILVVVLPPLLYYAAFGISFQEFKKNWREIFSLALGLVVVTTLIIGLLFKWLFPDLPWALAFAFGAIVSPPDTTAVTAILKRFHIGPRLLTILEGESLINDASALVLYKLAVTALLSGIFSYSEASIDFVKTVSGGVVVGAVLGFLLQRFSRHFFDPIVGVLFSFTIPYTTYILADSLGVSGVLAVVVNGLIGSRVLLTHHSSLRRILGFAVWDIFIILLNCFVFILIGLQLRGIANVLTAQQMLLYSGYALLITFAMLVVRLMWVYARCSISYVRALAFDPKPAQICTQLVHDAAVIGWSGMRGIVSLTAALALPYTLASGAPLEGRNEVIFITFVVILLTLVVPGLTLSSLISWLHIHPHSDDFLAGRIRKQLVTVAQESIRELNVTQVINDQEFSFLTNYFNLQHQVLEISTSAEKNLQNVEAARRKVIQEQRKRLLQMWEKREIDDKLLMYLEHELDVQETHIARAELK